MKTLAEEFRKWPQETQDEILNNLAMLLRWTGWAERARDIRLMQAADLMRGLMDKIGDAGLCIEEYT